MEKAANFAKRHWKKAAVATAAAAAVGTAVAFHEASDETIPGTYSQVEGRYTDRRGVGPQHYYLQLEQCEGSTPQNPLFNEAIGQIAAGCEIVKWDIDPITYFRHDVGGTVTT